MRQGWRVARVESLALAITPARKLMLAAFAAAVVFLIAVPWLVGGILTLVLSVILMAKDDSRELKRRMGVLVGCVVILAWCDINTSTSNANFLQVGIPFTLVIALPALLLHKSDPGVVRFRFWPVKWRKADVIYTVISFPLAWVILSFYWKINPELYLNWSLPNEFESGEVRRLFWGINLVGIWDELFFVNTAFAILRSLFRFPIANALQAVLYTAVLYDMAFTGIGPLIVYLFAWTQGSMYEKSESFLWVLIVHLIVDFLLVAMIVGSYYPGIGLDYLWTHKF